jgi:nitroimidazol reductase NimA-like FMN-containing flavoprotein (pyridoxamine 5'-phosphate oxidase superfamily)
MPERPDIRLTADQQAVYLRANRKCALATLDKDGFPHVTAMNFVPRDGAFYMTSYGKAQKVVNIRRNPKTAIMVETGSAYAELKGVMVRGECQIIEGEDAVHQVWAWSAEARGETYSRPAGASSSAPKRVVLKIVPHKIVTWDHSKLGGRY